eukprot:gene8893-9020_t
MPTSPTTLKRFLLLVLVVSTLLFEVAAGAKCPDGTDGLTKALYEAGDPSKYAAVTCIPAREFYLYSGDIVIAEGLAYLTSVETYALARLSGTLIFKGNFPLLSRIGLYPFQQAGNADSKVELLGELVPELSAIGNSAFSSFKGTVIFTGSFPLLSQIGSQAFSQVFNTESKIELVDGLPKLSALGSSVFNDFKGTVIFTGSFPVLSQIGSQAFYNDPPTGHPDSKVELLGELVPKLSAIDAEAFIAQRRDAEIELLGELVPKLSAIDEAAFNGFTGTMTFTGSFPLLSQIGVDAFDYTGNADSKAELLGELLPKLSAIGSGAFHKFRGIVIFKGSFPLLSRIEGSAFKGGMGVGDAESKVELVGELMPKLSFISTSVFEDFKGTVIVTGSFPLLSHIGASAFEGADNADSKVELLGELVPKLSDIAPGTFKLFKGTVIVTGNFPLLSSIAADAFEDFYAGVFGNASNADSKVELLAQVLKLCPVLCNTCKPPPLTNVCICAGIALDKGEGRLSDCTSIHNGRRYCYVAAGTCSDGVESVAVAGFHYSYLACQDVQPNPPPTGDKDAEPEKTATDTLHKHPASAVEIVGILLGVIILCGIAYQVAVQRRAGRAGPDAAGAGDADTTQEEAFEEVLYTEVNVGVSKKNMTGRKEGASTTDKNVADEQFDGFDASGPPAPAPEPAPA